MCSTSGGLLHRVPSGFAEHSIPLPRRPPADAIELVRVERVQHGRRASLALLGARYRAKLQRSEIVGASVMLQVLNGRKGRSGQATLLSTNRSMKRRDDSGVTS